MIHALAHAVDVALPVTATVADRYRTMIENGCVTETARSW